MDQESIVYGCIKDAGYHYDEGERRRVNRDAMMSLPSVEEWPLLSREMFAIPTNKTLSANYQTEVMHFGASYQAIEYEWEQWVANFEQLLKQMYWVSATVHLETELSGIHTFTWSALSDIHTPGSNDINFHCEWSREQSLGF